MAPPNLNALLQQALAHHQGGRITQAATLYAQVRKLAPQSFDAWHLGGLAAYQLGRVDEALPLLARALQLKPGSAPAHLRMGIVRAARGEIELALGILKKSVELDPKLFEAWEHLAVTYQRTGQLAAALAAATRAVELKPDSADAYDRMAVLISETQGMGKAEPLFAEAVKRWPRHARTWQNHGVALATLHEPDAALAALDRALSLDPTLRIARIGRALALQEAFRIREALAAYEEVLRNEPANPEAGSARLLCLNYLEDSTPGSLYAAHLDYGRVHAAPAPAKLTPRVLQGPLRVAVLSPDLRRHAVASFFEPIVAHLDPEKIELHLYHDHALVDAVSARFQARAARWRHVAGMPDGRVEALIRADAPDVVIDLSGHTGRNRLPLFARRLAPVQITCLGYPNTTGLTEMDYRLTDAHADPEGLTDAFHTEQLVRLPVCAWTFLPPAETPEFPPPCTLATGAPVVFGSFNNPAKLTDVTLRLWARVLAEAPGSRLLLKGHGLESPARGRELLERCSAAGLPADRVDLLGRTSGAGDHLGLYRRVDITLDPIPYSGTTTTCEALWMGRPVVTLAGGEHRSRVGVSLLQACGHPEWIAASGDDYVAKAAALAGDRVRLAAIASGLRGELSASPLLDHAGRAHDFMRALHACHEAKLAAR